MFAVKLVQPRFSFVSIIVTCMWTQVESKSIMNTCLEYEYILFKQLNECVYMHTYVHASLLMHTEEEWRLRSILHKLTLILDSLLNPATNPQNSKRKRAGRGNLTLDDVTAIIPTRGPVQAGASQDRCGGILTMRMPLASQSLVHQSHLTHVCDSEYLRDTWGTKRKQEHSLKYFNIVFLFL